jgi:hypothetical protein
MSSQWARHHLLNFIFLPQARSSVYKISQNAETYNVFFHENSALKKDLKYYHSKYISLKKMVERLEKDVGFLKIELEDLDECVDKDTVVNLIQEIVPLLIGKKDKGEINIATVDFHRSSLSESSKDPDGWIEEISPNQC